jgi:hypothetical protein
MVLLHQWIRLNHAWLGLIRYLQLIQKVYLRQVSLDARFSFLLREAQSGVRRWLSYLRYRLCEFQLV